MKNPYTVLIKPTTLPITLLNEKAKNVRVLDKECFESVFGPKKERKEAKCIRKMIIKINLQLNIVVKKIQNILRDDGGVCDLSRDWVMAAGKSRRI